MNKDEIFKDEIFEYLDNLRESGICNMFGSANYVQDLFGLGRSASRDIVKEWMMTFGQRMKKKES